MQTLRAEPITDGRQPMTCADDVSQRLFLSGVHANSQGSGNAPFLKNDGTPTSPHRTATSNQRMLQEEISAGHVSSDAIIEEVDHIKRLAEQIRLEIEEFKRQRQAEISELREDIMRFRSSGNSESLTPVGLVQ